MEGNGFDAIAKLTEARFLDEVRVEVEGTRVTITGERARRSDYLKRAYAFLAVVATAAVSLIAVAVTENEVVGLAGIIAFFLVLAFYGWTYVHLWQGARVRSVTFDRSSISDLRLRTGPTMWEVAMWGWVAFVGGGSKRVEFDVEEPPMLNGTSFTLRIADEKELVQLYSALISGADAA